MQYYSIVPSIIFCTEKKICYGVDEQNSWRKGSVPIQFSPIFSSRWHVFISIVRFPILSAFVHLGTALYFQPKLLKYCPTWSWLENKRFIWYWSGNISKFFHVSLGTGSRKSWKDGANFDTRLASLAHQQVFQVQLSQKFTFAREFFVGGSSSFWLMMQFLIFLSFPRPPNDRQRILPAIGWPHKIRRRLETTLAIYGTWYGRLLPKVACLY